MPGSPDDQRQYNPSQEQQWDPQSYNLYQQQQQQQWESSYGQYPQQYWGPPTQAYDQAQSQQYGPSGQQYSNLQATQAASAMQGEQYGEVNINYEVLYSILIIYSNSKHRKSLEATNKTSTQ